LPILSFVLGTQNVARKWTI